MAAATREAASRGTGTPGPGTETRGQGIETAERADLGTRGRNGRQENAPTLNLRMEGEKMMETKRRTLQLQIRTLRRGAPSCIEWSWRRSLSSTWSGRSTWPARRSGRWSLRALLPSSTWKTPQVLNVSQNTWIPNFAPVVLELELRRSHLAPARGTTRGLRNLPNQLPIRVSRTQRQPLVSASIHLLQGLLEQSPRCHPSHQLPVHLPQVSSCQTTL